MMLLNWNLRRKLSLGPSAVKLVMKRWRMSWLELARSSGAIVQVLRGADEGGEGAVVERVRERVIGVQAEVLHALADL